MLVDTIEKESPRVDAGGQPFTAELYLEVLENISLSFEEDGTWREPDFWHPNPNPRILARIKAEKKRFENELALRERLESIISRKRQEWNDREANRKLVD